MSLDISSLSSIYGLLNSTSSTNSSTSASTSSTSFENYLLSAIGSDTTSSTLTSILGTSNSNNTSSLLEGITSTSSTTDTTNSLLAGLTSSSSSSDLALQLLSSLQNSDTYSSSLNSLSTADSSDSTTTLTDSFTSVFQTQILSNMNAAKAKLQNTYQNFVEQVGNSPIAAVQSRINEMQQNIQVIDQYISTNKYNSLLSQNSASNPDFTTSSTTSTESSLLDKLNANADLAKSMLNL